MSTPTAAPVLPAEDRARLVELLTDRREANARYPDHDDPRYHVLDIERQLAVAKLTEQILPGYAAATGRCAEHLSFDWGDPVAQLDEARHPCRNRATRPSGLCGTHDNTFRWDRPDRLEAQLAGLLAVEDNQRLAEQLRAHGLHVDGVGVESVSLSVASARALRGLLATAAEKGVTL